MKREIEILSILKTQFHKDMPYGGIEVREIIDNLINLINEDDSLEFVKHNLTGI